MALEQQLERGRTPATDRAQIETVLASWKRAMEAKDAATASSFYSSDAVICSLAPPLRTKGVDPQELQAWFDTWKSRLEYEMRDVELVLDEELAYCLSLTGMQGVRTSGEKSD